jgi:hypothetical protein
MSCRSTSFPERSRTTISDDDTKQSTAHIHQPFKMSRRTTSYPRMISATTNNSTGAIPELPSSNKPLYQQTSRNQPRYHWQ